MPAAEMIHLEIAGAEIKIPKATVMQNFLDSLNRQPQSHTFILNSSIPKIGEFWDGQGGINAGMMRNPMGKDYFLIVPIAPEACLKSVKWGAQGEDESGAKNEWDGISNTLALIESKHSHPAAEQIAALIIGGHSDFYLPSRQEIKLLGTNVPELFEKAWYWSSTQCSPDGAWMQYFSAGGQDHDGKCTEFSARAVRRLII